MYVFVYMMYYSSSIRELRFRSLHRLKSGGSAILLGSSPSACQPYLRPIGPSRVSGCMVTEGTDWRTSSIEDDADFGHHPRAHL